MKHRFNPLLLVLFSLLMAVPFTLPTQATPDIAPGISAQAIDEYLFRKGSPLAGYGRVFVRAGQKYGVDPRFIVAIAGAESTFGTNGKCATENHNAWGYGGGDPLCVKFSSWTRGIVVATWQIGKGDHYFSVGNDTIQGIGNVWCGSKCQNWVRNVTTFYTELGGDISNLHFAEQNPVPQSPAPVPEAQLPEPPPPVSQPPVTLPEPPPSPPQPPITLPEPPAPPPPPEINYAVSPTNGACGSNGIVALKLFPLGEEIGVAVYKCSQEPFAKDGSAYLLADGIPILGPINYRQGDSHVGFTIKPTDYGLNGTHQLQAYTYAVGESHPNETGTVTVRQR